MCTTMSSSASASFAKFVRRRARRRECRPPVPHHLLDVDGLRRAQDLLGLEVADAATTTTEQVAHPSLLRAMELVLRLGVGVGREHVDARDHVRRVELLRRLELLAVERDRLLEQLRREVRREPVGQPERGGELRAEEGRPEDVERHVRPAARASRTRPGTASRRRGSPGARARPGGTTPRPRARGASRAACSGRCPAPARDRGRCGRDAVWRACRTARRSSAGHGSAA